MKLSTALFSTVFALTSLVDATVYCPAVVMPTPPVVAYPSGTAVFGLELSNQGGQYSVPYLFPVLLTPDAVPSGIATLTQAGLHSGWNFGNGGLGYPWCPTSSWLNIVNSIRPWKPLVWGAPQSTTTWKAGYSKYLTANATNTYSESDDFLACKPLAITASEFSKAPKWTLFLLTDGILPTASDETLDKVEVQSCVKTKLFITSVGLMIV
ncbi:hypothetical protein FRC05_010115 [Tulasnella sp. 425]|nr:hypothetical protein FRC05_010115 [Tulasnella sp. 425]